MRVFLHVKGRSGILDNSAGTIAIKIELTPRLCANRAMPDHQLPEVSLADVEWRGNLLALQNTNQNLPNPV